MKNITTLLIVVLYFSATCTAQIGYYFNPNYFGSCNNGTNAITPHHDTVPGFTPVDSTLPCIITGQVITDTIYFKNVSSVAGLSMDSWIFDSIYLPAGLCWQTNKSNNTFGAGEDGVIYISGTATAQAGLYKLRIIADVVLGGVSLPQQDAEQMLGWRYKLRVGCAAHGCIMYNYADTGYTLFPDISCWSFAQLTGGVTVPITDICEGDSTFISSSDYGYSYHWSNGDTASAIIVKAAGDYTLTVYAGADSVVSRTVSITAMSRPYAHFQLIPDPTAPHVWLAVNQSIGNNLSYSWIWGDNTAISSGATPSHTYADTGYYDICVSVYAGNGCSDNYCDSSVYLYKDANQMIQMNVVQYALGVNDLSLHSLSVKCYAEAIHFSPIITVPSEVKLYDMSGRVVMKQSNWLGSSLDVNAIGSGVYVVTIQNNKMSISRKLNIIR